MSKPTNPALAATSLYDRITLAQNAAYAAGIAARDAAYAFEQATAHAVAEENFALAKSLDAQAQQFRLLHKSAWETMTAAFISSKPVIDAQLTKLFPADNEQVSQTKGERHES